MFFFKKNSPTLRDLIPPDYVDIHSHILYGIDDGAKSIEDSIVLVNNLIEIGFSEFITTPHVMGHVWENSRATIENKLQSTIIDLKNNGIHNFFQTAAEYMLDDNFKKLLESEKLLTLKDNYILIEMSYLNAPLQLYDILFEIQVAGYKPILAHPERYSFYHNSLEEYKKLKHSGCLFQMNLLSSVGYYGSEVSKSSDYLLKNNLVDFVGSDVHHLKHIDFFNKKIILKNIATLTEVFKNNYIFKS